MAHTIYENFVLENKIEDILTTAVDLQAYMTVDNSLSLEPGMKKIVHTYTASGDVEDLAMGHVKALNNMNGLNIYNLGTGNGYSVLEMVNTFMDVNKINVNYKIAPRRDGDIAMCYADSSKAYEELGWKAEKNLQDMVSSAYNYAVNNKK